MTNYRGRAPESEAEWQEIWQTVHEWQTVSTTVRQLDTVVKAAVIIRKALPWAIGIAAAALTAYNLGLPA